MASIYGYIILIVTLSMLLSIVGVSTGVGSIVGKYFDFSPNADGSFNMSTMNSSEFSIDTGAGTGTGASALFKWLAAVLGIGALIGVGVAIATKDIGQALKSGLSFTIMGLLVIDFGSLIRYAANLSSFGGIVGIIACVVYIPIVVGLPFAIANWIGGSQ